MGLCKCPQRKVTNIFCYEHRVNVCEFCLMKNHTKCVVDTYRNWITDSLYSTKCALCDEELSNAETIRLLCFDIVHWSCLDSFCRNLPATTAPAGYNCPCCKKMSVFPALNQVSPIADALREKMGEVNWARAGLGLPLLDVEFKPDRTSPPSYTSNVQHPQYFADGTPDFDQFRHNSSGIDGNSHHMHSMNYSTPNDTLNSSIHQSYASQNSYYSDFPSGSGLSPNARKSLKYDIDTPLMIDEDENKYRRRSPFESLSRWLKTFVPVGKRRSPPRRTALIIIAIIVFIILLMVLFGRDGSSDEEGFNPQANPHIQIGDADKVVFKH